VTADSKLVHVSMIGVPLDMWTQARNWFEGLLREFDVLAAGNGDTTPQELVDFVADVRERFSRFSEGSNAVLEEAYRRGAESADVELALPPEAAPVARQLWEQIVRAEEYCRRGDLLTLTPDEDLRRYVRWYLNEVADQLEGAEPRAWDDQPSTR
jgi:hypothetical protein